MSAVAWIVLLVILLPMIGLLVWLLLSASLVRIPPGRLGLLLERGRATDTTLPPGPHFVFAFRRRTVEEYPSIELTYRAGGTPGLDDNELEHSGPALTLTLGDRAAAVVAYSVRFRLLPDQLRLVHERFGSAGIVGIVRSESNRIVTACMGEEGITVMNLFGPARQDCQTAIGAAVAASLRANGIEMTGFLLETVDLGRTGEVIQATVRARYELDREHAEAATRLTRVLNDAELQQRGVAGDGAWRYRETDVLRDLVDQSEALQVALHGGGPGRLGIGTAADPESGKGSA